MESEVALIRKRIEQECAALRLALDGFAVSSSHEAITARYDRLGACQTELEELIGPQAGEIVCEVYIHYLG
ncbi:MAG TPA: hypothetical protein VGD98_24820 [Ktedonobacteraceae bacterium]